MMKKGAEFSTCRNYRYSLWRIWDTSKPYVLFIGLNPSTADENEDDNTITRCIDFAHSWGYGGVFMANLFAFKATDPSEMKFAAEPIGDLNDAWLLRLAKDAGIVVAAWGNDGKHLNRSANVRQLVNNLHYLKLNVTGEPAHPLYLSRELKPKAL